MKPNLYVHIPKTGGTYVRNWLIKECNLVSIIPENLNTKSISGSFGNQGPLCFLTHDADPFSIMPMEDYGFKFTLLRHPFSMFKSFYNYYRSGRFIPHNIEAFGKVTMDCAAEYVSSILKNTYEEYVDLQIKKRTVFPNNHFNKKIIDKMDFVGISEMMDESLGFVAKKIGIRYLPFPKANKTEPTEVFEYRKEEILDLISGEVKTYQRHLDRFKILLLMEKLDIS